MTVDWRETTVAPSGTHHLLGGEPLYTLRFTEVLKFHAPGLAPVRDETGAFHIDVGGAAAYDRRFVRAFGFYEGRAAVEGPDGWHHVMSDGGDAYRNRWSWCGNFQGGRCPARDTEGRYRHIRWDGTSVRSVLWRYAGDYRDGIAVVQGDDGLHTHVDLDGAVIHGRWFLDLDVFHKGFARARDGFGWMHVDRSGLPAYERRFAAVEPFYNGQARVERVDGGLEVIDERGGTAAELRPRAWPDRGRGGAPRILLVGLPGAGKSTVGEELSARLRIGVHRLDDYRRAIGDRTVAGDYLARAGFLRACTRPEPAVYEFSASGYHRVAVRQAFRELGAPLLTAWIDVPTETRRERLAQRGTSVPLPDWGIAPGAFDEQMEAKLRADFETGWWKEGPGWRSVRLDGRRPASVLVDQLVVMWNDLGGAP